MKKIFVILLLAFSVVALFADDLQTLTAPNWFCDTVVAKRGRENEKTTDTFIDELWQTISSTCEKYEMDPVFIAAVISVESNFTNAKGAGGVLGMMQILPSTAKSISNLLNLEKPSDWNQLLTDYKLNITYGTAYLSHLFKKTGSLTSALESYNGGKNKKTYAQLIMSQYENYKLKHEAELAALSSTIKTLSLTTEATDVTADASATVVSSSNQTKIISPLFAVETDFGTDTSVPNN